MGVMRELPVVLTCRRCGRLPRRANRLQISARPASARGAYRDRHDTRGGMRWTRSARSVMITRTNELMRTWNRVVLASRCWCQVYEATSS